MILAFALAAAVLFGAGAYLLQKRDLIRMVAGIMLISQCAVVTLLAASLSRGQAAIAVSPGDEVSDPLPQALALTALVIGLATVALLLALVHRAIVVFRTAEQDELAATETEHEAGLEPERRADREEVEAGAEDDLDGERPVENERAG
ncbi:NADH-quinone oxidoreductase subunit K [Actinophytocola sp. NPDC049390]|uniref:NADH-quinone oxidoreductase subunit K n=1 Tax=Actinophytocola sp. NPDC049390 TaxID=3363894 RepID=UPI00379444B2